MCSNENGQSKFQHFFKANWYIKKNSIALFFNKLQKTNEYAKKRVAARFLKALYKQNTLLHTVG